MVDNVTPVTDPDKLFPDEPNRFVAKELDRLLVHCQKFNTSDITIQTGECVIAEIYGALYRMTNRRLSNTEVGEMLNSMYGPNGTTQLLSGRDIDTHYEVKPTRSERFRYRVNATACMVEGHDAIQITLRTIPSTPPLLETMHLPEEILSAISPQEGVVYVTGATGSGKSTLLASIIRHIAEAPESNRKILTYEAPIEFVYDGLDMPSAIVSQSEIPRHLPTFAAGVRNALRRKPRLILVGEARDAETISAALEAAMTGHPVYTTLHTNGVAETIRRLVTTFPADERRGRTIDIVETIRLIVWQKLVPTVDGKRVALREYLVFTEALRDRLLEGEFEDITAATRKLVQEKGQTMAADAEKKFKEGVISERVYKLLTVSPS
ncbi:MAG: Dot/Icm type IV secretion system ATPase DotB [Gammaproteobacteria bacterium]|nr:Dot/Icm type IV secretion system ATPase DotB [Gammaproteobacteria bacterium]